LRGVVDLEADVVFQLNMSDEIFSFSHPETNFVQEICLGILGNLACHSKPEKVMVSFEGLVPTVIQQLQFEDPPSLCETCRSLS
jgi:hypothetical protein